MRFVQQVLAAKRRWQNLRKAAGKPYDKPNIVMNAAVQVCCTLSLFFVRSGVLLPRFFAGEKAARCMLLIHEYMFDADCIDPIDLEVEEKYW